MTELLAKKSYRVLADIHKSTRFEICKADSLQDGQVVAIKTAVAASAELHASLTDEASTAVKLKHAGIRRGLGFYEDAGKLFMVAEYIEGISLGQYLLSYPQGVDFATGLAWAKSLASALAYAASQGVAHLNLNPYNIIVCPDQSLKIIGFGKKRKAWRHSEGNIRFHYPIMYIPPEEYNGSLIHANSDLYSWAVVVYQIFTGQLPWRTDSFISPEEQKEQSMTRAVLQPDSARLPSWLYSLILDCLKMAASARIKSAAILSEALKREGQYVDYFELEEYLEIEEQKIAAMPPEEPAAEQIEPELPMVEAPLEEEPVETEPEMPEQVKAEPERPELPDLAAITPMPVELEPEAPKPVEIAAETSAPKPVQAPQPEARPSMPKAATHASIAVADTSKIKKPSERIVFPDAKAEKEDLSSMQKAFKWLLVLSLVIIVFLVGKYFLSNRHRSVSPSLVDATEEPLDEVQNALKENISLEMLRVQADTLIMGSIDPDAADDEFPLISIGMQSFLISATEVTQAQWLMVYESNPSIFRGDHLPVENVSFYDAIDFCNAKSVKDGLTPAYSIYGSDIVCDFEADGYRLPTEAEWEFAAKAGKGRMEALYSGGEDATEVAWYNENANATTRPVGSKKPNRLGIYDLSGNVYEWVWNWYAPYSYRTLNLNSGPDSGTDKVIRGGSWYHDKKALRVSARAFMKPFAKNAYTGFRVVRSR